MNIIYGLISKSKKLCYIGKTKQDKQRLVKHRHDMKRWKQGNYGYCSSYRVVECSDCEFAVFDEVQDDEDINEVEKKAIQHHAKLPEYEVVNIKHNKKYK